jgi:hypothetical protein
MDINFPWKIQFPTQYETEMFSKGSGEMLLFATVYQFQSSAIKLHNICYKETSLTVYHPLIHMQHSPCVWFVVQTKSKETNNFVCWFRLEWQMKIVSDWSDGSKDNFITVEKKERERWYEERGN